MFIQSDSNAVIFKLAQSVELSAAFRETVAAIPLLVGGCTCVMLFAVYSNLHIGYNITICVVNYVADSPRDWPLIGQLHRDDGVVGSVTDEIISAHFYLGFIYAHPPMCIFNVC